MPLYLKDDVKVEPLSGRWYAWHHLVSPLQRGFNIDHRHIPLFKSFMADPKTHRDAAQDPDLMGGPFMDLEPGDVDRVGELMDETLRVCEPILNLSRDFRAFEKRVCTASNGYSMDKWYAEMPRSLSGLVECLYDHRNVPHVSVREKLLYEAEGAGAFQEIYVHRGDDDKRKFFLNTPRLGPRPGEVMLPMSFDDERIDLLSRMRICPVNTKQLESALPELADPAVRNELLTEQAPERVAPKFDGDGVRIRYFGHACLLVETRDVSILIDPMFAFKRDQDLATLTFHDLPDRIDYVFISHGHQDHFCFESLLQLRRRIGTIVVPQNNRGCTSDPSMGMALASMGFDCVRTVEDMDAIEVPGGYLLSVPFPGEHCDMDMKTRHCAGISLLGRRFLCLVDSDAVDNGLYERVRRQFHDVDALFLGMECHGAPLTWLYGPLLAIPVKRSDDESRRGRGSDCQRAYEAGRTIGCKRVYVYAMGMEPWNRHLLGLGYSPDSIQITESNRFVQLCQNDGIPARRLRGCEEFLF
jgi:L-ascorbate metabolism protein UlaG (beta-lactamase superfamily)